MTETRKPRVALEETAYFPQKARVLAMLALTRTDDVLEITRMFGEY